jgi:hypothetical protein
MTVKTVSMDKPEINSFFEFRSKETKVPAVWVSTLLKKRTKTLLAEGMATSELFHNRFSTLTVGISSKLELDQGHPP